MMVAEEEVEEAAEVEAVVEVETEEEIEEVVEAEIVQEASEEEETEEAQEEEIEAVLEDHQPEIPLHENKSLLITKYDRLLSKIG